MHRLKRWIFPSGSVQNMRDLGGYACDGGMTKYGVILRSDQLHGMTEEEKLMLKQRGLTDVIDLRSEGERNDFVNDFAGDADVLVHTISLDYNKDAMQFSPSDFTNMGQMYCKMADANARQYTDMVRVAARAKGLCVVHCMAGKDRTGIICALILLALGVDEADVVANYQISETHNLRNKKLCAIFDGAPETLHYLSYSTPENMNLFIAHLGSNYGSAVDYLKQNGLTDDDLLALASRMVEPAE